MNNNNNKMQQVEAGNTLIWKREEKSGIYLLSEFIDNAKSSYEMLMEIDSNYRQILLPITITFSQEHGYISVEDFGTGFEIVKALRSIGRDEARDGQTNQYFIGMKSAMNFFGDYSIVISERKINGENRRFVNFFVYMNGICQKGDIELEAQDQTGSTVYVFANHEAAKTFWNDLEFINLNDAEFFPISQDELKGTSSFSSPSKTEELLNNLQMYHPLLTASLLQRYSPLVNKFPNIKIIFRCFDKNGNNLLLENDKYQILPISGRDQTRPIYFKEITANNYEAEYAFDFERFFSNENNKLVEKFVLMDEESETRKLFVEVLLNLLKNDFNQHFSKLTGSDQLERDSFGKINYDGFEWLNPSNPKELYQLDKADSWWSDHEFASNLASIFVSSFLSKKGKLSDIAFKISNLVIRDDNEIVTRTRLNEPSFDLVIKLNLYSENYSANGGVFGSASSPWFTGFTLVQNNRAIYHGPNFGTTMIRSNPTVLKPFPERRLVSELNNADSNYFPNYYVDKKAATNVQIGGNVNKWPSKIYGTIEVPNSSIFVSGTNKAQVTNQSTLDKFVLKILRDSGVSVLARWVYLLDNDAFKGKKDLPVEKIRQVNKDLVGWSKSTNIGKVLLKILSDMYFVEVQEKSPYKENGDLDIDLIIDKADNEQKKIIASFVNAVGEKYSTNLDQVEILQDKDERTVLKHVEKSFRNLKNSPWCALKINQVELVQDKNAISLQLRSIAFANWKNRFNLIFDMKAKRGDNHYTLEDDEPIELTIPLDIENSDIPDLTTKLSQIVRQIYICLTCVQDYEIIANNSKYARNRDRQKTAETIENFLDAKLDRIGLSSNNEQ